MPLVSEGFPSKIRITTGSKIEVKSKYRLITDNHCVYIHRIVWGLSFCVVIVCIHLGVFLFW